MCLFEYLAAAPIRQAGMTDPECQIGLALAQVRFSRGAATRSLVARCGRDKPFRGKGVACDADERRGMTGEKALDQP